MDDQARVETFVHCDTCNDGTNGTSMTCLDWLNRHVMKGMGIVHTVKSWNVAYREGPW